MRNEKDMDLKVCNYKYSWSLACWPCDNMVGCVTVFEVMRNKVKKKKKKEACQSEASNGECQIGPPFFEQCAGI